MNFARIVPADSVGDPACLEGLARRIFGEGDRPAGWFARKLRRERVDPTLSVVAIRAGAEARDPAAWLGYVLVGRPPSLGDAVRTAGTGVDPTERGRGLGSHLLRAAMKRSREAGFTRMQVLADLRVLPFYLRHELAIVHRTVTVLGFSRGQQPCILALSRPWDALAREERELVAWLPEAWEGTDLAARRTITWTEAGQRTTAWISREGVAWLVHRLVAPSAASPAAIGAALLNRLDPGDPVLLPLLPETAPATRALLQSGWVSAQRSVLLVRTL